MSESSIVAGLAGKLHTDMLSRALYSTAACIYQIMPQGLVLPSAEETANDVRAAVRYAAENGLPITARGGGSSLAGQAVGAGLVIDFSRHANRVLAVDRERRTVRTQPGITLAGLNAHLAPHDLFFAPDPSSGDYATIGGMIANNSSGPRSVKYGSTIDYVTALRCVLADGALVEFRGADLIHLAGPTKLAQRIRDGLPVLLETSRPLVERHFPKVAKNSSGYRLDAALAATPPEIVKLLVGSEGTLAIVTEAELEVLPRPAAWSMVLLDFDDLERAGEAVAHLLPLGPSAVEIIDRTALDLIRANRPDLARYLPHGLAAQLFVEFDVAGGSPTPAEATQELCRRALEAVGTLSVGHTFAFDPATHDALMGVRKATLPILYTHPGPRRVAAFIEDVTVPPERLPEFIRRMTVIFDRHGVEAVVYGHAGQGNLHVRPLVDLKRGDDVEIMERVAEETFRLVAEFGGTISGEHGDGRVRSAYLPLIYGEAATLFGRVKDLFDPAGMLNPGIKVPERAQHIAENLRFGDGFAFLPHEPMMAYPPGTLDELIERCHGCGQCRTATAALVMCPVFRATGEEAATPRAKANLLRLLLSGQIPRSITTTPEWKAVLDTCIGCRMCSFECPSHVDAGRMVMDAKARYAKAVGRTRAETVLGMSDLVSRLGSATAPLANRIAPLRPARWAADRAAGVDARRVPPRFSGERFSAWYRRASHPVRDRSVVYFVDQWAEFHDPAVGKALAAVLGRHGVGMIVPPQEPCGIAALANGDLEQARHMARRNIEELRPFAEAGYAILSTEPTATLVLRDEYPDLVGADEAEPVARAVTDASDYVERLLAQDGAKASEDLVPVAACVGYHAPCHLKALRIGKPSLTLLRRIPGLNVVEIERGCCGMAGTWGMKHANYDRSMTIGEGLVDALLAPEIEFGVTDCSTCAMQMTHGVATRGVHKPTVHPLKLLARSYGERV